MSIKEKLCPHKPSRQVTTAHGLFCLDCGHLKNKISKNKSVVQKLQPTALSTDTHIIPHRSQRLGDTNSEHHIKISMADITPKKRR